MWNTLVASLHSKWKIILFVALSGIASLLLSGGRTTHSKYLCRYFEIFNLQHWQKRWTCWAFKVDKSYYIGWGSNDYKFFSEALDKSLKDMSEIPQTSKKLFGGKVVVFCGDFRQILSVVSRDSTSDIIHATVNASYIWDQCRVIGLTTNTRLKMVQVLLTKRKSAYFQSGYCILEMVSCLSLTMAMLTFQFLMSF